MPTASFTIETKTRLAELASNEAFFQVSGSRLAIPDKVLIPFGNASSCVVGVTKKDEPVESLTEMLPVEVAW